jgi:alkylation response protein AidB-like acyl-CoA dehydrogenase
MWLELTEEQKLLQQTVRRAAQEKMAPLVPVIDQKDHEYADTIRNFLEELGLLALIIPKEYGGPGGNLTSACIVAEELGKVIPAAAGILGGHYLAIDCIEAGAKEDLRSRYFTKFATGKYLAAICLTEPEAGSDAAAIKTKAIREGDHYVLNGRKCFITSGGMADLLSVFAKTTPGKGAKGISLFVVERNTPGISTGKLEDKMGMRGAQTAEVIFEDAIVPAQNLVGEENKGFFMALEGFDKSRPLVGALSVGLAQAALDQAIEYAKVRVTFGKPIAQHQAIRFMIADMAMQIEAARALVYKTAAMSDLGYKTELRKFASMSKCFGADVAMKVTTDVVQIFGGYGYMRDYPVERMMRDAKLTQIFDGTNQIHRMVIASSIFND